MRHLPILFGAAALAAALVAGPGPSSAMPAPSLKHAAEQNSAVETVGYYRRRWRRGYPYWGGYWGGPPPYWRYRYARPYWGWGYPYRRGWGYGGWGGRPWGGYW